MAASFEELRSLAYNSISGSSFTELGIPLLYPCHAFCITNNTDGDMFISIDGVNPYLFIPANGFRLYDVQSDAQKTNVFPFPARTQFSVEYSSSPSKGAIYLESLYSTNPGY